MTRIVRNHDGYEWTAHRDDYDVDEPIGHGATEFAAVQDLIEQLLCEEPGCDDAETTHLYRSPGSAVASRLCERHKPYWARKP